MMDCWYVIKFEQEKETFQFFTKDLNKHKLKKKSQIYIDAYKKLHNIFLGRIYNAVTDLTAQWCEVKLMQLKADPIFTEFSFHRAFFNMQKFTNIYLNEVVLWRFTFVFWNDNSTWMTELVCSLMTEESLTTASMYWKLYVVKNVILH